MAKVENPKIWRKKGIPRSGKVQEKGRFEERRWPPSLGNDHDDDDDDDDDDVPAIWSSIS